MIEVVVVGSPIRNGFRRVQVGMSTFVDEAMAIALVNGGRAVYKTPPASSDAAPVEPSEAVEEPQAEAATPAPTETEAPPDESVKAPAEKPKKRRGR